MTKLRNPEKKIGNTVADTTLEKNIRRVREEGREI